MEKRIRPILSFLALAGMLAACNAGSAGSANPPLPVAGSDIASDPAIQSDTTSIYLRSAATFAILAGSTVTNTGPTRITGNVGIFPGSAITGFPPGAIKGTLYAADGTAQQAEEDLTTAYNQALRRTHGAIKVTGNLGGRTLYPGLYKSTGSLSVSSGTLTLDARNKPNAVWVFQTATLFSMTSGRQVKLTHGALARNVFWAVGTSATFGTGCSFQGTLLAHQSISMATGTVMVGRALARIGAVTMQSNTLVMPPAP